MQDLKDLLDKVSVDFGASEPEFHQKKGEVSEISTLGDLMTINGREMVEQRLDQFLLHAEVTNIEQERLLGNNNLMDIYYLERGLEVAKTVCRLVEVNTAGKKGIGTGFLVGPGLLMTNHHVIGSPEVGMELYAEFEYETKNGKINDQPYLFQPRPELFFITSPELDYTIIALEEVSVNNPTKKIGDYKWNKLVSTKSHLLAGEYLTIIQHPDDQIKMIAFRENTMISIHEHLIHYITDTLPGASGSLVANDNWEVVALHRSGVAQRDEDNNIVLQKGMGIWQSKKDTPFINWIANQGVLIDSILTDLSNRDPHGHRADLKTELLAAFKEAGRSGVYRIPKKLV